MKLHQSQTAVHAGVALLLAAPIALAVASSATPSLAIPAPRLDHGRHEIVGPEDPRTAIPGHYIVVLNDHSLSEAEVRRTANRIVARYGGAAPDILASLCGFTYLGTAAQAARVAQDDRVQFVEQDRTVRTEDTLVEGGQPAPRSWGLDRLDQRVGLDGRYRYPSVNNRVTVYIVDSGIRTTHREFRGRATWGGNFAGDGRNNDCTGHGTHVAGTVAGATTGVARSAHLVAMKVFGCNGSGSMSNVLRAVEWIIARGKRPAVVNLSLGSNGQDPALAQEIAKATSAGFTFVAAAGNSRIDACRVSPAMLKSTITVGGTNRDDRRDASYSNFGSCVTLFAPGTDIYSASNASDQAFSRMSGTSMAAPHVAGVIALILGQNPGYSPTQVMTCLLEDASMGRLTGVGTGSPNTMAHVSQNYRGCAR